ncbi:MAG: SAM-dependent methyltransferase [Bacteriovoracia bacterium]
MRVFPREKIPLPPDFSPLALRTGMPLDIEIGCGVGFHPLKYARENPGRQLVAFERTAEKFARFQGRLAHHPALPNLRAIHGDAIPWITHGVSPGSVDRYFLLYPNPYPKESQRNLRFHEMPFFSVIVETMRVGGLLTLATNMDFYRAGAKEKITGEWGLELVTEGIVPAHAEPRTHFEKKYLARGEICWDLVFRR